MSDKETGARQQKQPSAARALLTQLERCGHIALDTNERDEAESERASEALRAELARRGGFAVEGAGHESGEQAYAKDDASP